MISCQGWGSLPKPTQQDSCYCNWADASPAGTGWGQGTVMRWAQRSLTQSLCQSQALCPRGCHSYCDTTRTSSSWETKRRGEGDDLDSSSGEVWALALGSVCWWPTQQPFPDFLLSQEERETPKTHLSMLLGSWKKLWPSSGPKGEGEFSLSAFWKIFSSLDERWKDSMPGDKAGILHGQMQAQGHSVLGVHWNGGGKKSGSLGTLPSCYSNP